VAIPLRAKAADGDALLMLFVGIDPGKLGAVGAIDPAGHVVCVRDMTLDQDDQLDYDAMGTIFEELAGLGHGLDVTIEEVRPMPHWSKGKAIGHDTNSAFKLGASYGAWRREVSSRGIKPHLYSPSKWKGIMLGGLEKGKEAAVGHAIRIFPASADLFRTKRGRLLDGRAEALLLAELGRRIYRLSHGIG
jgi:hypothetical protein